MGTVSSFPSTASFPSGGSSYIMLENHDYVINASSADVTILDEFIITVFDKNHNPLKNVPVTFTCGISESKSFILMPDENKTHFTDYKGRIKMKPILRNIYNSDLSNVDRVSLVFNISTKYQTHTGGITVIIIGKKPLGPFQNLP